MKKISIERKSKLSPEDFIQGYLQGLGLPVIITDAMESWGARRSWTLDFFRQAYGSDFVLASYGLGGEYSKATKLGAYIDYLDNPKGELPGLLVRNRDGKPALASPSAPDSPAYLLGWSAFQKHPELYEDIRPAPYFVSDWALALNPTMRELFERASGREYWSVYVGPEGSLSGLHVDFWQTHAYLAQVLGRKRAILFSPEDSEFIYGGQVDPERPDFEQFPLLAHATAYECVIEPGEMLFIPSNWWHCVRALEESITVSHNFFNETNANEYLARLIESSPAPANGVELPEAARPGQG